MKTRLSLLFLTVALLGCGKQNPMGTGTDGSDIVIPENTQNASAQDSDANHRTANAPSGVPGPSSPWYCESNGVYYGTPNTELYTEVFSAYGPDLFTACAMALLRSYRRMEYNMHFAPTGETTCGGGDTGSQFDMSYVDRDYVLSVYTAANDWGARRGLPDLGYTSWGGGSCKAYYYNARQIQ